MKESFFTEQQKREKILRADARAKAGERQQKIVDRRRKWADLANGIKEEPKKEEVLPFSDWHHEVDQRQRIIKRRQALAKEEEKIKKDQFYAPIELKTETPEIKKKESPLIEELNKKAYQNRVEKIKAEIGDLAQAEELAKAKPPIIPIPHITSKINYQPPFAQKPAEKPAGWFKRNWTKLKETMTWGW
ncbi:MAG: hypothetical protein WCW56_03260 [Candidatus Paceibacterota bacterium]|jgi:hypothetical protein